MTRIKDMSERKGVLRIAPIACVVMLGVAAAGCGSSNKTVTNKAPTTTVSTGATTATPQTTPPPTTAPKTGGAGF